MAAIKIIAANENGSVVTEATIRVAATSKQNALMRALDAIEKDTRDTGRIYSISTYTTKQDRGSSLYYIVTVSVS